MLMNKTQYVRFPVKEKIVLFFEKILQTQYVYMRYFCPSSILIPKSSMTSRSSAAILSFMYALARYIPALTTTDMLVTRSIRYFRIYWNDKNRLTAPRTLDKVLRTINRKICGLLPAWSRSKSVTGKSISFCEQVQLVLLYLHY